MAFTVEIAGRLKYTVRDKLEGTRKMANIYFRRKRRLLYSLLAAVLLSAFVLAFLVWNGYLLLNNPSRERYPVRGVDVSKYQGEIDWPVLAEQEISFAFIKATEGSSHVDARFAYNYEEARKTGLRVGAYHFFSFDSGGDTQAENFIRNVEAFEGMLPPVIDLEFYGDKAENPPGREEVRGQLDILHGWKTITVSALSSMPPKLPMSFTLPETIKSMISGSVMWSLTPLCLTGANGPSGSTPTGNVWTDIREKNALLI